MQMQTVKSNEQGTQTLVQRIGRFLAVYGMWTISAALIGLTLFNLHQILLGLLFGRVNPWQLRAATTWGFFLIGAVWLGLMMLSEWYCRKYLTPKTQLVPLVKILAVETVIFLAAFGIQSVVN